MGRHLLLSAAVVASILCAGQALATTQFIVSYEAEGAGIENTTATFSVGGVETFDNIPVGTYPQSITTNFGTSGAGTTIDGTYTAGSSTGLQINAADQYGGAGGTGNYIVAFPNTPYTLSLTSNVPGGVNYFGFWLSALDKGNYVTFYGQDGQVLFTFEPQDAINAISASADPGLYYGNPNSNFKGQDSGEPFIFLNFFDTTGSFSKISFNEVNWGGGYESDNQTVGHYLTLGQGTVIPLTNSIAAAPEPSTWAMLLLGLVGLFYAAHPGRRNTDLHRRVNISDGLTTA